MADETQEGANFIGSLTEMARKNDAYNALSHTYGPAIAYNPENAFNAAQASVAQQTVPTQVQDAEASLKSKQLSNTSTELANKQAAGDQQRLGGYRAAAMLMSQADPETGAIPSDAYDKIVRPHADLLGIDPAHVDDFGTLLSGPGGAQHLQPIMQSLIGPTKMTGAFTYGLDANGQPVAIGHDQFGNVVQRSLGGTTTVQQQRATTGAQTLTERGRHDLVTEGIGQQNANSNAFRANTTANNSEFGNPGGTLPQRGTVAPAAGPVPSPGTAPKGGVNAIPQDSLFAKLPPKGKQEAIGQATQIVNQGTNLQSTNQILDSVMKQISPYTAGAGSLLKDLPGTAQTDLKANLKTLQAQGLTSWIQSLKNGKGQTGIGRVLQSEANAAMALFGNMEQDQSAKQLAFHADLFRRTVNKLYQHAQEGFHTFYGVDAHSALGETAPPAGGGALPAGWSYLGARRQ